jgi:hypothetical protein
LEGNGSETAAVNGTVGRRKDGGGGEGAFTSTELEARRTAVRRTCSSTFVGVGGRGRRNSLKASRGKEEERRRKMGKEWESGRRRGCAARTGLGGNEWFSYGPGPSRSAAFRTKQVHRNSFLFFFEQKRLPLIPRGYIPYYIKGL